MPPEDTNPSLDDPDYDSKFLAIEGETRTSIYWAQSAIRLVNFLISRSQGLEGEGRYELGEALETYSVGPNEKRYIAGALSKGMPDGIDAPAEGFDYVGWETPIDIVKDIVSKYGTSEKFKRSSGIRPVTKKDLWKHSGFDERYVALEYEGRVSIYNATIIIQAMKHILRDYTEKEVELDSDFELDLIMDEEEVEEFGFDIGEKFGVWDNPPFREWSMPIDAVKWVVEKMDPKKRPKKVPNRSR